MKKLIAMAVVAVMLLTVAAPAMAQAPANLYQTAINAGSFTKLIAALKITHLDNVLRTGGPYTILAPTDDAFNKLPAGTVAGLMANRPKLTGVLKNHIISGKYTLDQLVTMGSVGTLDGQKLAVTKGSDGAILIGGARVIKADVPAKNGIVDVIDGVLVPG